MPFFWFKKGKTEEKESQISETASAYGAHDYVEPSYEQISPSTIQQLYDQANLLKKYIKTIIDECLRYEFKALPKKKYEDDNEANRQADKRYNSNVF